MPNKYTCSDGSKVTEATIKRNLSIAYRQHYFWEPKGSCEGCGINPGQGSAHIVPKARLKQLGLTDYIWKPISFFRSCHSCNTKAENINSAKELLNYDRILQVTKELDYERYLKMTL